MKFNRNWDMPNSNTFSIPSIKDFLSRHVFDSDVVVDPFARGSSIGTITNDLNPEYKTTFNMEARDFLKHLIETSVTADVVLFDPPYSPYQMKNCYSGIGLETTQAETQSSFYSQIKTLIRLVVKPGGKVLTFSWNSCRIHKDYSMDEVMLVNHGGWHNDTICTAQTSPVYLWDAE